MELLLVIGIIAILAALLFPALNAATARANETKCMGNARQWGTAMNLYVAENEGAFPSQGTPAGIAIASPNVQTTNAWYNVLPPLVGSPAMSNLYLSFRTPRPRTKSIFVCPQAPTAQAPSDNPPRAYYANYAQNMWLEQSANLRGCAGAGGTGVGKFLMLSQVAKPSAFAVMAETTTGLGANGDDGYKYPHTHAFYMGYPQSGDAFRHNGRANVTFADGHASGFAKTKIYSTSMLNNYWNYGGVQWNPENPNVDGACP